jgi:hypothetical protein
MKFTTLFLGPIAVSGAAIRTRDEDWSSYDGETQSLASMGLCRIYPTTNSPAQASGLDMCEKPCASVSELIKEGDILSLSCIADQSMEGMHDPAGEKYLIGECKCNLPIISWGVGSIVEGLPAVGRVTCAVWKLGAMEAGELLAGSVTGMSGGTQTLAKVAKMLLKAGKGAGEYEQWVRDHSQGDEACDFSPRQLFDDFVGIDDSDLPLVI